MARPKKVVEAKVKRPAKDPRIEEIYEQEVTFTCPVRGKVTQKVKIKRFKPLGEHAAKHVLQSSDSIDRLEEDDDGLSIYSDGEALDLEDSKEGE